MSPKFINQKQTQRVERIREITDDFMSAKTAQDLNELSELYYREMKWPEVSKQFAAAAKRIMANETVKNLHNSN